MRKRKIVMLYGEKTVPLKSRRIPESKKAEIEGKIDLLLLSYHNLKVVEIDCEEKNQEEPKNIASQKPVTVELDVPSWKRNLELADGAEGRQIDEIPFATTTESSYDGDKTKRFDQDESSMFPKVTKEKWESVVPKKIEPTADVIISPPILETEHFPVVVSDYKETVVSENKADVISKLKDLANPENYKGKKEKEPKFVEGRDFEIVTSIPSDAFVPSGYVNFFCDFDNNSEYWINDKLNQEILKFTDLQIAKAYAKENGIK